MMKNYTLHFDKETDAKFRWTMDFDGVSFHFYVPQAVVSDPPPDQITVWVGTDEKQVVNVRANLKAVLEFIEEHSRTIRYAPIGDPKTWQIGEPYIPMAALPQPWPPQLHVAVSWDSP